MRVKLSSPWRQEPLSNINPQLYCGIANTTTLQLLWAVGLGLGLKPYSSNPTAWLQQSKHDPGSNPSVFGSQAGYSIMLLVNV